MSALNDAAVDVDAPQLDKLLDTLRQHWHTVNLEHFDGLGWRLLLQDAPTDEGWTHGKPYRCIYQQRLHRDFESLYALVRRAQICAPWHVPPGVDTKPDVEQLSHEIAPGKWEWRPK